MRYLIKFSKEGQIKFISHLDLMRTLQRVIRRAALPVEYSKGFNPHMSISLAQPLSVGMYSVGEYMDIELTEEANEEYIKEQLNKNAPSGIKVFQVIKVKDNKDEKKVPQSMALIDAAKYIITIKYKNTSKLDEELKKLINEAEWNTIKKSKSGEKLVNIKSLVKKIDFEITEDKLVITAVVACGSRENLSAALLGEFIKNSTTEVNEEAFVDIMREEMYVNSNDKLLPIYSYIS